MGPVLELLAAVLVDMDGPQDGDDLAVSGERDGTRNLTAVCLRHRDNLFCRRVDEGVIVALEPDSDLLFQCHLFSASFSDFAPRIFLDRYRKIDSSARCVKRGLTDSARSRAFLASPVKTAVNRHSLSWKARRARAAG